MSKASGNTKPCQRSIHKPSRETYDSVTAVSCGNNEYAYLRGHVVQAPACRRSWDEYEEDGNEGIPDDILAYLRSKGTWNVIEWLCFPLLCNS